MVLLTQNAKMRKSSKDGVRLFNWSIPALTTCPNAGDCARGCYARSGAYLFGNVKVKHEANWQLTKTPEFVDLMINEIRTKLKRPGKVRIRIHDAGDYYSLDYLLSWIRIINAFKGNDQVDFYCYTKQVELFKDCKDLLPESMTVIFSQGGKQDNLIDVSTDRHARVFESIDDLKAAGYTNASDDDNIAVESTNNKIGLVYHGGKNYVNTNWSKVA